MLAEHDLKIFRELVSKSSQNELIWMHGFLTGQIQLPENIPQKELPATINHKITLAYGTETGNAKKLATQFATAAKKKGLTVKLSGFDQYRLSDLPKEEHLFAVVSTQGDGEPPASAKKFFDHIYQESLSLPNLKFGVLGLGDTSYPLFCKAAEDLDAQIGKLGAERIIPLQKCDTDYEAGAHQWFEELLQVLSVGTPSKKESLPVQKPALKKTYSGSVITNILLNDTGSAKQTHHIEIRTEEAVNYQPGDAAGFVPHNNKALVDSILAVTGLYPKKKIVFKNHLTESETLLTQKMNLVHLPERIVSKYAAIVSQDIPPMRMDLLDLLKIYPVKDTAQFEEVLQILEPVVPRLYSIASSPAAHGGELHLTVAKACFTVNNEQKHGLCSDYLARLAEGDGVDFYIHPNHQFKLPDAAADVVMIGPGTGIAPFRSFLAERDATGAAGRNWLFFGEQHFTTDFLYQTEIQGYAETGLLTKVNVAFSRDQQEKIYVQHRMKQEAAELYEWISKGAYVFVCGSRIPMSVDVEETLIQIIAEHGVQSLEEARDYLYEIAEEGRYVKDVY